MGYTHYYQYATTDPAYQEAWPRMVADAQRIVERVQAAGVVLDEDGDPPVTEQQILVNGDVENELDCEPLWITRDTSGLLRFMYDERGFVDTFCKTDRMPYDLAVCAILLHCHLLVPQAFLIRSDGEWDDEWANGAADLDDFGNRGPGARAIVAELFDETPTRSPFTVN